MPNTAKYKNTCRLWRVNIDGKSYEGRWKHAGGAISAAYQLHTQARDDHGHLQYDEHGKQLPAKDFTDVAIHVECIGDPLEPYVKIGKPVMHPVSIEPKNVYLSAEQQNALMMAWHDIVGGTPPEPLPVPVYSVRDPEDEGDKSGDENQDGIPF